jgi:ABC-type transport system involved in cytochrome c biogenesis ATPase subunit
MDEPSNLIYLLGRNSSGKTSFLTALASFDYGKDPRTAKRYENFNTTGDPKMEAVFSVSANDLTVETLLTHAKSEIFNKPNSNQQQATAIAQSQEYKNRIKPLEVLVREMYGDLISRISEVGSVCVRKDADADFLFAPIGSDPGTEWNEREQRWTKAFVAAFPNNKLVVAGTQYTVNLNFADIEDVLFKQFPRIVFFQHVFSLLYDLPDRITTEIFEAQQDLLLNGFILLLGTDKVDRFLKASSPRELEALEKDFAVTLKKLTDEVNRYRLSVDSPPLLGIMAGRGNKEGLQITVTAGESESSYQHLSENTKFLFSYYLYRAIYGMSGRILLFDEPNNGFHATAQEQLLNFLQGLANAGVLVVLSTHSEYLIEPTQLGGVRLMDKDDELYPCVRNHYFSQLPGTGKGDYLALRPVLDAIGLRYGSIKMLGRDNVVIVEGVTDFLYLRAFATLLNYPELPAIAPARGDKTILLVMPLFISQGVKLKVVLDTDKQNKSTKESLKEDYGLEDKHIYEVPIPAGFSKKSSGIEDLFSKNDFEKLLKRFGIQVISADFSTTANSDYIKRPLVQGLTNVKRLAALYLYQHISEYPSSDFDGATVRNFQSVLDFCMSDTWFTI